MRVEEITVDPIFNLLGMTKKEFIMLKTIVNRTGYEEDECVKEHESVWEDYMDFEEARKLAGKVANIIWKINVEEDYQSCKESAKE